VAKARLETKEKIGLLLNSEGYKFYPEISCQIDDQNRKTYGIEETSNSKNSKGMKSSLTLKTRDLLRELRGETLQHIQISMHLPETRHSQSSFRIVWTPLLWENSQMGEIKVSFLYTRFVNGIPQA